MKTFTITLIVLASLVSGRAQVPPPPPASVAEVQAGTVKNKFVSPYTLAQAGIAAGGVTNLTRAYTWQVDPSGVDSVASNRLDKPFLHIRNAVVAANAMYLLTGTNQWVAINAGQYAESDLLLPGVNYLLFPGANLTYIQTTTNDSCRGIWDDQSCGATTNTIICYGDITYFGVTNGLILNTNSTTGIQYVNGGSRGLIVTLTNLTSRITAEFHGKIKIGAFFNASAIQAFDLENGSGHVIAFNTIEDPFIGMTNYTFSVSKGALKQQGVVANVTDGLQWTRGNNNSFKGNKINVSEYAFFWNEPNDNIQDTNDFYFSCDSINGKFYGDAFWPTYKGWINFNSLTYTNNDAIIINGGGKWYFSGAQKIYAPNGVCIGTTLAFPTVTNAEIWIANEKYTGSKWIDLQQGTFHNVLGSQFEDETMSIANGITISGNGNLTLEGGQANMYGSFLSMTGGKATLKSIDVTNQNNATITLSGGSLVVNNVSLNPTGTNAISAATAQTIVANGLHAVGGLNPNITVSKGAANIFSGITPASISTNGSSSGQVLISLNSTAIWTNLPATILPFSCPRTNWVSGAYWTNNTGTKITVFSDELVVSAALGNTGFMLLYDPAGGHNWETNCNGVTIQVATSIVGMTNPNRMSGPVAAGGVICWTNLSTVGSASLQNGYYSIP